MNPIFDGKQVEILLPDGSPTGLRGLAKFSQQIGLSQEKISNIYTVLLPKSDVEALEECSREITGTRFFTASAGVNMLEEYLRLAV